MMVMQKFSTHGFEFEFEDNTGVVLEHFERALELGLNEIGERAVEYARAELRKSKPYREGAPGKPAIDTSALYESVGYYVDEDEVYIGAGGPSIDYASVIEFGSGKFSTLGGGTPKESWLYKDEFGQWHMGFPMKPRPFIAPAAKEHTKEYRDVLEEFLENA